MKHILFVPDSTKTTEESYKDFLKEIELGHQLINYYEMLIWYKTPIIKQVKAETSVTMAHKLKLNPTKLSHILVILRAL